MTLCAISHLLCTLVRYLKYKAIKDFIKVKSYATAVLFYCAGHCSWRESLNMILRCSSACKGLCCLAYGTIHYHNWRPTSHVLGSELLRVGRFCVAPVARNPGLTLATWSSRCKINSMQKGVFDRPKMALAILNRQRNIRQCIYIAATAECMQAHP